MPTTASSKLADRISLRNLIDAKKRLDELGVARIVANVAEVVHKQQKGGQPVNTLTPDAIVVAPDGEVSLQLTDGHAAYTAPERLRGEAGDRRSDVFSLGAILWEALAHERLFDGEIDGEIKAAVLEGEYRSVSETNANVPSELDAICKKALSRTPADRYPSCKVMAAEIATVLDDADYPEDNTQIATYLATKYVPADPKPIHIPTSKATPLPGTLDAIADRAVNQTLQGVSPRAEIDAAKARVAGSTGNPIELTAKKPNPAKTLIAPSELKKPAEPVKPPEPEPPRAKTPSGGGLPSWAMAQPTAPAPEPSSTLPGMPSILNTPPAGNDTIKEVPKFSKTAVLGSLSSQDIALPPVEQTAPQASTPSVPVGKKTEPHGSSSLADRLAAINAAANVSVPGLPSVPPGADPIPSEPVLPFPKADPTTLPFPKTEPSALKPPAGITTAETVPTPALAGYAAAEAKAAAALDAVTQPPMQIVTQPPLEAPPYSTPPASEAVAMPAAATGTAVAAEDSNNAVHPASVVALPRAKSKSEHGRAGTEAGGRDPVAGWGWGTGPHEAIQDHDDDFYETQKSAKKRLVMAIGGAAAVIVIVIVAAFAFGGSKEKKKTDVAAKQTEPAVDWSQPTDTSPAQPDPGSAGSAVDPNAGSAGSADPSAAGSAVDPIAGSAGSAVDPSAGSATGTIGSGIAAIQPPTTEEPPKPEPPKPEPPKPEPPKTEPPKPEQPVAKTEPPKKEPPKTEPPKKEPPKKEPPKTEPKVAKVEPPKKEPKVEPPKKEKNGSWDPLKPTVKTVEKKPPPKEAPKPIDPYAEKKPAVDANVAYKTGIQQFARGDSNGALTTFKTSLAANPDFAPTWRGIGMVYEKLGKKSQAKTAFRRYLQLSPSAGDAEQIRERMERL